MLDSPKTDYLINDVDLDITKKELWELFFYCKI
jgi:hypothetical protein